MKKSIIAFYFIFLFATSMWSQTELNPYKYILVPSIFKTLKEVDKFRMNSMTKYLFEKNGFKTILEHGDTPKDYKENPCLALKVNLKDESSMFTTKLTIELFDCFDKKIYASKIGRSKLKEFSKSYQAALRDAFTSFDKMNYAFNPDLVVNAVKEEVESVPFVVSNEAQRKNKNAEPHSTNNESKVVPLVVTENVSKNNQNKGPEPVSTSDISKNVSIAKSFKNKNISFLLIEQGNELKAYIKTSNSDKYKIGELIGTFSKTSIPKVYRLNWKNNLGKMEATTAHFDEKGNLLIDIIKSGNIEVVIFEAEK